MKFPALLACLFLTTTALAAGPPFILPSQQGNAGKFFTTNGTNPSWANLPSSGVTSVTASSPLASSGGATPNLTIQAADATHNGYLSLGDWSLFNAKQSALLFSLPLVNTSGTISIPPATAIANGYLTSSDWSVFNAKQPAGSYVTTSRLVSTSAPLTGGGSLASDLTLSMPAATSLANGYLTSSDWSLFNGKQAALTFGSISTSTTGVTVASGSNSTVGPNVTVNIQTASVAQPGLLSAADWAVFNGKQAAGSYLTNLTGDVSASGPGSAAAVVNSVGGSSASAVNTAEVLANAATSANTANTIVKRGASGEFTAGAITASGLTVDTIGGVLKASSGVVAGSATTSDLPEGSNLYYSDTRVQTAAKNGTSSQILYVSKDAGNDAYDGSLLHPYKTISAAITAANAVASYYKQVNIHVSPINNGGSAGGNYNENLTLSQQGVNLICDNAGAYTRPCTVGGTLTFNLTGTSGGTNFIAASNEATVAGFVFTSGASTTVTFSGSTYQRLIAMNCYFQAGAAHSVVETNTGLSGSTPSEFRSYDTTFENNSSTLETVTLTAGRFWLYGTTPTVQNNNASGPSVLQNGPSSMIANIAQFTGQYQLTDNTATATFNLSTIASGTAACLTTPSSPNTGYALFAYAGCNTSASPSITGTGVVVFATGNACVGTGCSTASTVTTSSLGKLPEGGVFLSGATGALTAVASNEMIGYGKTVRAMKIENMVGTAATFTCSVNPAVTLYDCGTSAGACTSGRTALASVTLTAANTGTNGSVTSATLAAGHYWSMELSAGTCTVLNANVSAEGANQ